MEQEKSGTDINYREKELLSDYVLARKKEERLSAEKSSAYKEMMKAQGELMAFLDDMEKKSTGQYTDLGMFSVTNPIATFKVPDDKKDLIYPWVHEIGAEAVIKETIHHATLQSLLRERYDKNESIPDYIEINFIPQARYTAPKGGD